MAKLLTAMLTALAISASAQSIKIDVTTNPVRATTGQTVSVTKTYTNQLTKRPPILIKASCEYTDYTGEVITTETQIGLEVVQPVKVTHVFATIPLNCTYVIGSGKIEGSPIPPITSTPGTLTWATNVTLNEGEKLTVFYQFIVK